MNVEKTCHSCSTAEVSLTSKKVNFKKKGLFVLGKEYQALFWRAAHRFPTMLLVGWYSSDSESRSSETSVQQHSLNLREEKLYQL